MSILRDMPSEVLIAIYTQLPSFSDVFALATTCRHIRGIWCSRTTTIYQALAPREIKYLYLARQLLEDQGGAAVGVSWLCADDVRRLVRNAHKADKSAERFGREIAAKTNAGIRDFYFYNNTSSSSHPPYLTTTERSRFTRAYYRLCSLLQLPPHAWEDRLKTYTFRQLHRTLEMSRLPFAVGEEVDPYIDPEGEPEAGGRPPWVPPYMMYKRREQLECEMNSFIVAKRLQIYPKDLPQPDFHYQGLSKNGFGGWMGFITLFDHYTPEFWEWMMMGLNPDNTPQEYSQYIREEIWGDSSDEETYRPKNRARRRQ